MNYREILSSHGFRLNDHGSYWTSNAAFRGGDNPNAIQIYKNSGVWRDYVEGSNFLPFEALLKKLGVKPERGGLVNKSKIEEPKQNKLLESEKTYDQSCLKKLLPHLDFYDKRGISKYVLNEFKCGLATSGKMYQRIVFPILREDQKIIGFAGRNVSPNDDKPKWLNLGKTADWFYPYFLSHRCKTAIEKKKSVFIVESIGDCLSLFNAGVFNVLVSFGLNLSPKFIARINALGCDKIFVSFNNDKALAVNRGCNGAVNAVLKMSESIDISSIFYNPPPYGDFGDMSKEKILDFEEKSYNTDNKSSLESCIKQADEIISSLKQRGKSSDSMDKKTKKIRKFYNFYYGE